jgi:hypothetical protein
LRSNAQAHSPAQRAALLGVSQLTLADGRDDVVKFEAAQPVSYTYPKAWLVPHGTLSACHAETWTPVTAPTSQQSGYLHAIPRAGWQASHRVPPLCIVWRIPYASSDLHLQSPPWTMVWHHVRIGLSRREAPSSVAATPPCTVLTFYMHRI